MQDEEEQIEMRMEACYNDFDVALKNYWAMRETLKPG